jgi:hypothetical protein
MARKIAKRRPGRPVTTGIRPYWGARFSKEVADGIDRFAKQHKVSRSEAIRQLVERALRELKP